MAGSARSTTATAGRHRMRAGDGQWALGGEEEEEEEEEEEDISSHTSAKKRPLSYDIKWAAENAGL